MQILVVSDLLGEEAHLVALIRKCSEYSLDAICFCGNVVQGQARWDEWMQARRDGKIPNRNQIEILQEALDDLRQYKLFCSMFDSLGIPVLMVPGHLDSPEERFFTFMQQAAFLSDNLVLLHENVTKVGSFIFTGFGGEITAGGKEDYFVLNYPRNECVFGTRRMHFLNPPRILLFHSPPISKLDLVEGMHKGTQFVNDIIHSVAPSFLFCGHVPTAFGVEEIENTIVINPGALAVGRYAVVDTKRRDVQLLTL